MLLYYNAGVLCWQQAPGPGVCVRQVRPQAEGQAGQLQAGRQPGQGRRHGGHRGRGPALLHHRVCRGGEAGGGRGLPDRLSLRLVACLQSFLYIANRESRELASLPKKGGEYAQKKLGNSHKRVREFAKKEA